MRSTVRQDPIPEAATGEAGTLKFSMGVRNLWKRV